jgi:hypothetical protein
MRIATIFILAAVLAAAPAAAQNEADANMATANAAAANAAVPANDANAVAPGMNYVAVEPPTEITPPPTTRVVKDRGFPWGIIGLVGLIGLLGRRRRD